MPFNLLLIPLLGGYIFVRFWNYTKIPMLRSDKDRILIRASLAGFFSLVPAFLISIYVPQLVPCSSEQNCLYTWWAKHLPFEYSGVSVIAFCISSTGWWFLNWIYSEEKAVDHAINEDADPLEVALKESKDLELPLAITLQSGKVYVGVITHQFNPATPTNNIAFFPLQSGYRDAETKKLHLNINYATIIKKMRDRVDELSVEIERFESESRQNAEQGNSDGAAVSLAESERLHNQWEDIKDRILLFEVVVPVGQITSVFFFDEATYEEYFVEEPTTKKRSKATAK